MLFEPGPGYLRALEKEFARKLLPLLRKTARGKRDFAFARVNNNVPESLDSLANRIVELCLTLKKDSNSRLAWKYMMARLHVAHSQPQDLEALKGKGILGEPMAVRLAKELLAEFDGTHV